MTANEATLQAVAAAGEQRRAELRACGAMPAEMNADPELQRYRSAWRMYRGLVAEELYEREFPPVQWRTTLKRNTSPAM